MPRNGSGTYSLPQAPFVAGTTISSAAVNSDFSDIATALTGSLPRDGQAGMLGQFKAQDGSTSTPSISFSTDLTTGFSHGTSPSANMAVSIAGVSIGTFSATGWSGSVTGQNTIQVGMVFDFAGSSAPAQYLLCFGQAVSRTTYSVLFGIVGTTYGVGDGSTTFNVPDLRGIVVAGLNNMGGTPSSNLSSTYYGANPNTLGTAGGSQNHTLTATEIPTITSNVGVSGSENIGSSGSLGLVQSSAGPVNVGGSGSGGSIVSFSVGFTSTGTGTSNNTGGAAHTSVQPSIVMNKIIFAGV